MPEPRRRQPRRGEPVCHEDVPDALGAHIGPPHRSVTCRPSPSVITWRSSPLPSLVTPCVCPVSPAPPAVTQLAQRGEETGPRCRRPSPSVRRPHVRRTSATGRQHLSPSGSAADTSESFYGTISGRPDGGVTIQRAAASWPGRRPRLPGAGRLPPTPYARR